MRISKLYLWTAAVAVLAMGCFESTEDELDAAVVDMAVACEEGATEDCALGAGCGNGTRTCTGGVFGECVAPAEICDGIDNNCDGTVDEGFDLGAACTGGTGRCAEKGVTVCNDAGDDVECSAEGGMESAEVCDGQDNDCDGEVDDDVPVGMDCMTGLPGVCSTGTTACTDGVGECVPGVEPSEELCDGLDNDCDGNTDEAEMGGALARPCYEGDEGTEDVGQCAGGFEVCAEGAWGACEGQTLAGEEICDGVDNDCNGEIDDTGTECVCNVGETQECYTGTEGTAGMGACTAGTQTCLDDGSAFGPCEGEIVDRPEVCDGIDNDCDGEIDDVSGVGGPCAVGEGTCATEGTLVCNLDNGMVECDAEAGLPGDEVCDGEDNDCNGTPDDVAGVGEACEVGEGACLALGVQVCGPDGLECSASPGAPGDEICDGVDNDCDGEIDNAAGIGEACEVGVGACRSTGINVCSGEGVVCGAVPQEPALYEYCDNGRDDDCDGDTDEPECRIPCADETVEDDCGPGGACDEEGFCVPVACVDPTLIEDFGTVEGDTTGAPSQITASCASRSRSPENAYELQLGYDGTVCIDTFGSGYDTSLYVRSACDDEASEIDCNDDASAGLQSQLELDITADGTYFVFVDGFSTTNSGPYQLTVRPGPCGQCASDRDCVRDEFCAPQAGGPGLCVPEGCGDGIRDPGEACDDGDNEAGDGCSPRCEIEEGFDCVSADIEPNRFDVDGLENCGTPPENPVLLDVEPWFAYRMFYVSGAISHVPGLQNGNAAVWVGEEPFVRLMASERGTPPTVEEAEALYAGLRTEAFPVPEGDGVFAGFPDGRCDDNQGSMTAELRAVDFCFSTTCESDDDCLFGDICIDGTCVEPVDSDGDGVSDNRDLDDDNDGIPDVYECGLSAENGVVNASFEFPNNAPDGGFSSNDAADVPGWSTTAGDNIIELIGTGFEGAPTIDGRQWAELNARQASGLYQDIVTIPGTVYDWSVYHRGRGGPEPFEITIGAPDAPDFRVDYTHGTEDWRLFSGTYTVPEGQAITRFQVTTLIPGALGNYIDVAQFVPRCDDDVDTDGDGVPNRLDLDADGDGVLDADEAGHGLPHTDGVVDGEVGNNGLADAAETAPDSGDIGYELVDVDGNGVYDFLEEGPYPCGNGEIGEGEQCDDGNRDNGDGCSDECVVEPDWECAPAEGGLGPCGPGEPVETIDLVPGDFLPITGGEGGNAFDDPCQPGEVVTGFVMNIGAEWSGGQTFVQGSQAQCAALDVVDGQVTLTPTNLTAARGQYAPGQVIACPEGAVVTGYIGYQAPRDDGVLAPQTFASAFGLVCGTPSIVDGRFVVGDFVDTEVVGDTEREFVGRFECPEGSLVGANAGRAGGIIDQLTVRCDVFEEACVRVAGQSVCEFQGECLDDADCAEGQLCRGNACVQTGACPDDGSFGEPNDDEGSATPVMEGRYEDLAVCGNDDWYTTEVCPGGTLTIDIYFVDDDGDIDLAVPGGAGGTSVSDDERGSFTNNGAEPATATWRVYGFSGAQNSYAMDVAVTGCVEACPDGRFPAECPEGYAATDGRTCEARDEQPAVLNGELLAVCRGPTDPAYGIDGALLPGGARIQNDPFFGIGADGSRLNTVGVWACGPDGQTAAPAPINEAIGFAAGFELAEPGEYVIGLGGDDNLVATVDGEQIFAQNGAFRSWYLTPVLLSGGGHIITLEGVNTGGPGGFGAEIYGPFPPGSTADDNALAGLDYANNVVYSSLEEVGGVFDTGVNSGYSCPEGYSLDASGDEPVCIAFDRLDRCELLPTLCDNNGDCPEGEVCVEGACEEAVDTDGDGISDDRDIDDDGDGIPDVSECFANAEGQVQLINGSLEEPPAPRGRNLIANQADVPGWSTTAADGAMELWSNGFGGVPSAVGNQFAELNANVQGALYQDIDTVPGTTFDIRFYHRARGAAPENMELRIGPPGETVQILAATSDNLAWSEYLATYTVPDGQVLTRFEFASLDPGSVGNFLDGVEFVPRCADENADADGDGIPNSLDLDSDGDGLLDAEEAGHDLPHTNGVVDGAVGDNGLVDAVETLPDSGTINYEIRDADESGIPDFLEAVFEICDNGADDDGDGAVDCEDRDCNLDEVCAVTRTVYFSAPASNGETPNAPTRLYTVDGAGALQLLGDILLDGAPIPVTALALSPDGLLWGFEYLPGDPVRSRLLLIDPDAATAMAMGEPVDAWINGAGFHPDGTLWVTDKAAGAVRPYDLEVGLGPAVLDFPADFLGSDITFDSEGNCYLTGVDVPFQQFPLYTCDLEAGTAEALPDIQDGPGFDNDGHTTIPAIAFAYDSVTCEERLYAFDSFSIDELGYIDLSGEGPVMTHIESTEINFSYYQTPDMAGFPSLANAPDCEGRLPELCVGGLDEDGDGDIDCDDADCAGDPVCGPAGCTDEIGEPDDDIASANLVEAGTIEGYAICDGGDDYFGIEVCAGGTLNVLLRDYGAVDLDVYIYNADGNELDRGFTLSPTEAASATVEGAQTLYVRVNGFGGSSADYTLDLTLEGCDGCLVDDDCALGQICSDGVCTESLDFDGDGIPDLRDLDDDNDGILDTTECTPGLAPVRNSSFEAPVLGDAAFLYVEPADQGGDFGWFAGIDGEPVEIQARGHATADEAALGRQYAEANAEIPSGFYQDVQTEPGTRYEWTMYHRGRDGEDTLELRFGAPGPVDGLTPVTQVTSNNGAWTLISGTYDVPAGQDVTRLSFATIAAVGGDARGNFIDGFTFTPTCTLDTDGDGLINSRDLDADGDGILDADEAGHGQPHTDGVVDGPVGGNGVPDAVETSPDSSDVNYEVAGGLGDLAPAADSVDDWTGDGRQGVDGWFYGYSDRTADVEGDHAPGDFIAFPVDGTDVASETNFWNGNAYVWTPGPPPWTQIGQRPVHPNGDNNGDVQWAIRRWVAPVAGHVRVQWTTRKANPRGTGVTGRLWSGGVEYGMATIAGDDEVGVDLTVEFDVVAGQAIDLAYDSLGADDTRSDASDGGENTMVIDLAPFGFDFLTAPPAGDCGEEPNEDIASASPIMPGDYAGCGLDPVGDRDVFAIEYCAGGVFQASVTTGPGPDFDLFLYDADGNELDRGYTLARTETVDFAGGGAQILYLDVNSDDAGDSGPYEMSITLECPEPVEVCDNGVDDDGDDLIDCGDDDCRDDDACAIERIVYFSMPGIANGENEIPAAPSRLYALDSAGNSVLIGEPTLNGQPTALTAIALHPDGELFGFAFDPNTGTSTPMTIDRATGAGVAVAPPVPAHIHGAGFAPDGTLYVMDRTNQQVRVMDGAILGAPVIDYPILLEGGDIAFDADGNCVLTGTAIAGQTQREIYLCDVEAGTTESLGAPQPNGFEDGEGRILISSLAFALNDQTCETELYTLDGFLIDELGRIDLGTDPPTVDQVASTGLNYAFFIQPDAAGFPSVINSPNCAGAGQQVPVMIQGFDMNPSVARIRTGDSVLWTNMDGARHTVTSGDPGDGDAGSVFDGEVLAGGGTFEFQFDVPGDYAYFCRPHAGSMNGYRVVVSDDPALTACEESCDDLEGCGLPPDPNCVEGCLANPETGACIADNLEPPNCNLIEAVNVVNQCAGNP